MTLRGDTVSKEAVHIAIGITPEGTKKILGYSIAPIESSENWQKLFENFRTRGLEEVSLFCIDEFAVMEPLLKNFFQWLRFYDAWSMFLEILKKGIQTK